MDLGQAEMGIPRRRAGHYVSNTRASLQLVDPFTSSIAQVAHNQQYPSHIDDIDDVHLPLHERSRFPRIRRQTPHGSAPSPYTAQAPRRPIPRHERSQPPVPSFAMPCPATPVLDAHRPVMEPVVTADSPLFGPPPGGESTASSNNSSRHVPLHYPTSLPSVDNEYLLINIPTPTPSIPSINSNSQAESLPLNQVPLLESPPQQPSYLSQHRLSQPVDSTPSLSYAAWPTPTRSGSSRSSADEKNDMISSPKISQYVPFEARPAASAAVAVKERIDSGKLFVTDILPKQLYLHCLFRLPYFYFSRVSRIFIETGLTLEEIHEMALQVYTENKQLANPELFGGDTYNFPGTTTLSPAYERLKTAWEQFIDTLIKEWKTLNIISVLLLSAIMTIFQIQGAAEDPLTRYLAFWSLICALTSLLYSCSFIIQFASMHKTYKAVQWAIEVQKIHAILWNVWVMLAMPMVWMIWSILTFIASIMSFLWRSRANLPSDFEFSVSRSTELGFRIFICVALGLGVVYGILMLITFWRYGSRLDDKWTRHVGNLVEGAGPEPWYSLGSPTVPPSPIHRMPIRTPHQMVFRDMNERPDNYPYFESAQTPAFMRSPWRDATTRSPKPSSWYRPSRPVAPRLRKPLATPPEIPEQQLRRSKSAPFLPLPPIQDMNNKNQDHVTNVSPELQDPQLHCSTSTSSQQPLWHYRFSSDNNGTNFSPMPTERQLRRSASGNLIHHSLPHPRTFVVKDPHDSIDCLPRISYEFVSSTRPPPATGHEQAIDLCPQPTHMPGSPLSSGKGSAVLRKGEIPIDGSSKGMGSGDNLE